MMCHWCLIHFQSLDLLESIERIHKLSSKNGQPNLVQCSGCIFLEGQVLKKAGKVRGTLAPVIKLSLQGSNLNYHRFIQWYLVIMYVKFSSTTTLTFSKAPAR